MTAAHLPKRGTKLDRGPELYETPPEAVRALLKVEGIIRLQRIWEPACGRGSISEELKRNGCSVVSTDLNNWGYEDGTPEVDFLLEDHAPPRVARIVTNPPYSLAEKFISHGLTLVPTVILLLRLAILEGVRKDCPAFDNGQLARVYVFRNRLPMLHRDGWEGPKRSNTTAYAWVVFERDHKGSADLHRISWEAK